MWHLSCKVLGTRLNISISNNILFFQAFSASFAPLINFLGFIAVTLMYAADILPHYHYQMVIFIILMLLPGLTLLVFTDCIC